MPFTKGHKKFGGKEAGTQNKTTRETKEVIADLLKLTAPIYAKLLIEKAESQDPDQRIEFMTRFEKLIEFDVPKLQRSEVKAELETAIGKTVNITIAGEEMDLG